MALESLGARIAFIREHLQLSYTELARYLQVPEMTIRAAEENKGETPVFLLSAMLLRLDVSTNWLLTGQGAMFISPAANLNPAIAPLPEGKYLALKEAALEARIRDLEQNIVVEASIPLQHIRTLFASLLQLPVNDNTHPMPFSKLEELTYDNKIVYCKELEKQYKAARERFFRYFRELYQNLNQTNSTETPD